jgi:hypothetical protein
MQLTIHHVDFVGLKDICCESSRRDDNPMGIAPERRLTVSWHGRSEKHDYELCTIAFTRRSTMLTLTTQFDNGWLFL